MEKEEKKYYDVNLEATVPVTIKYRVYAKDEEEAIQMIERNPMQNISGPPKYTLPHMRKRAAKVYKWGTNMLTKTKTY